MKKILFRLISSEFQNSSCNSSCARIPWHRERGWENMYFTLSCCCCFVQLFVNAVWQGVSGRRRNTLARVLIDVRSSSVPGCCRRPAATRPLWRPRAPHLVQLSTHFACLMRHFLSSLKFCFHRLLRCFQVFVDLPLGMYFCPQNWGLCVSVLINILTHTVWPPFSFIKSYGKKINHYKLKNKENKLRTRWTVRRA